MIHKVTAPVVIGLMLVAFSLPPARAATQAPVLTALPSIALYGRPAAAYVLCPVAAENRAECAPEGDATGPSVIAALRDAALRPGVDRVVIFLPGFRTKLIDGRLSAQHIQDILGPRFLVVHVDWGSHGSTAGYARDGAETKHQTPAFVALISALHQALPQREIDIFAHSMGCRVAAGAMALVRVPADRRPFVAETVMAAPDLALGDYEHAILRNPEPFGHVTIYASRHDKALFLSSVIHLRKRIGQLAMWRKPMADTSVVDASAADPKAEGHGYAIHDAPVIRDIGEIFLEMPAPHVAWTQSAFGGPVWTLVPARVPNL